MQFNLIGTDNSTGAEVTVLRVGKDGRLDVEVNKNRGPLTKGDRLKLSHLSFIPVRLGKIALVPHQVLTVTALVKGECNRHIYAAQAAAARKAAK